MEIIEAEEREKGFSPHVVSAAALEKQYGCDILSTSPTGEEHRVEVKGWGESFRRPKGQFRYTQDIRASQMDAARTHDHYPVEIVANLTAHLQGEAPYERLTLTAEEVRAAEPLLGQVDLADKEADIVVIAPD